MYFLQSNPRATHCVSGYVAKECSLVNSLEVWYVTPSSSYSYKIYLCISFCFYRPSLTDIGMIRSILLSLLCPTCAA